MAEIERNSKLKGFYSFSVAGKSLTMAGTFVADGNGQLSSVYATMDRQIVTGSVGTFFETSGIYSIKVDANDEKLLKPGLLGFTTDGTLHNPFPLVVREDKPEYTDDSHTLLTKFRLASSGGLGTATLIESRSGASAAVAAGRELVGLGVNGANWTLTLDATPNPQAENIPPDPLNLNNRRAFVKTINFGQTFTSPPKVSVSISFLDATPGGTPPNVRVNVEVVPGRVTTSGFDVLIETWDQSKVFGLAVAWVAMG